MTLSSIKYLVFLTWEQERVAIMRDPAASKTELPDDLIIRAKLLMMVWYDSNSNYYSFGDLTTNSLWPLADTIAFFSR